MHLRMPSFDRGLTSALWGVGFGLFLWLGMLAVDVDGATAFILAALSGGVIYLYIRLYGADEVRSPRRQKSRAGMR
jgi:hypothetical protein